MADPVRPRPGHRHRMTVRLSAGTPEMDMRQANAAQFGPDLQAHIGRQLRTLYDEVLKEPVPDRLRDLLVRLERKPTDLS
jgi:hypothetical protein